MTATTSRAILLVCAGLGCRGQPLPTDTHTPAHEHTPLVATRPSFTCEVSAPAQAVRSGSWRDVIAKIRAAQPAGATTTPAPVDDDHRARELLCYEPCKQGEALVSTFVDDTATRQAHVVVPADAGFWVVPRVAAGQGADARCPDEIIATSVETVGELALARFSLLLNYWDECNEHDDECADGCYWQSRVDYVVVLSPSSGNYVVLHGDRRIAKPGPGSDWQALEDNAVLPRDIVSVHGGAVRLGRCSGAGDAAL